MYVTSATQETNRGDDVSGRAELTFDSTFYVMSWCHPPSLPCSHYATTEP